MNQVTSLLSKFGIGGSSQDEGKAASKHPDAEARLSRMRLLHASPPACIIISFASTYPCLPAPLSRSGSVIINVCTVKLLLPHQLCPPCIRDAVCRLLQPSALADTPGGAETPGTKLRNKGLHQPSLGHLSKHCSQSRLGPCLVLHEAAPLHKHTYPTPCYWLSINPWLQCASNLRRRSCPCSALCIP